MFDANNLFSYGKSDYKNAILVASKCALYKLDVDEDELVTSTDHPTCYNCLYRRWTQSSFICMKSFKSV
jgi:hypothetical protein